MLAIMDYARIQYYGNLEWRLVILDYACIRGFWEPGMVDLIETNGKSLKGKLDQTKKYHA